MKRIDFLKGLKGRGRAAPGLPLAGALLATALAAAALLPEPEPPAFGPCGPAPAGWVAGGVIVQQAAWSATGGAAAVGVRVTALPEAGLRAEDQVFSLRPEAEGSAPLSPDALLRRAGGRYA